MNGLSVLSFLVVLYIYSCEGQTQGLPNQWTGLKVINLIDTQTLITHSNVFKVQAITSLSTTLNQTTEAAALTYTSNATAYSNNPNTILFASDFATYQVRQTHCSFHQRKSP